MTGNVNVLLNEEQIVALHDAASYRVSALPYAETERFSTLFQCITKLSDALLDLQRAKELHQ